MKQNAGALAGSPATWILMATVVVGFGDPWIYGWLGRRVPDCTERQRDDYCQKPLPCVHVVRRTRCDDYDRKQIPCVPAARTRTCNDSMPKSVPAICCPPPERHAVAPGVVPRRLADRGMGERLPQRQRRVR